jgi:hypothetical protein
MLGEAKSRLHDAGILGTSLDTRSDSQAFLQVLAFEVLLKAAVLASGSSRAHGHKYKELWSELPPAVQAQILGVASARMPGHADLSNLDKLLFWYQFVFEKARYQYELYDGMTLEEQLELGERWVQRGAPVEEAVVQYHPNELFCLTEGLIAYVESAL